MLRTVIKGVLVTLVAAIPALAQSGSISGRVTAADGGSGLPGTQISVSGVASTITRDDGSYSVSIRPGTYKVRAGRLGYARDSALAVVVTSGTITTVNFSLRPRYFVTLSTK